MNELELLVPAYSNPANPDGSNMWNTLIETAATSTVKLNVILNPSSGPGDYDRDSDGTINIDPNYIHPDPNRSSPLLDLENAGGVIYGYVATTFGNKPIQEIKNEIDLYNDPSYYYDTGFQIDGIFLDEMSNENNPETIAYYTEIKNYIKSNFPNSDNIIGNPGTSTIEAYVDTVDTLVTFENYGSEYRENYNQPDWVENYSADHFAHLIHTESLESDMQLDVELAKSRNVGMIYITDDVYNSSGANPWDQLATYWEVQSDLVLVDNGPTPTSGDDDLTYTVADDIVDALAGNDTIQARGGNDDVFGNHGEDRLLGQNGNDTLSGGDNHDTLKGGNGDDSLIGGSGNDRVFGGVGNDTLIGVDLDSDNPGEGEQDFLRGDDGGDLFVLGNENSRFYDDDNNSTNTAGNLSRAVIQGFDSEVDRIQLHGIADDYLLRESNSGHTKIFYRPFGERQDLIGVVKNTTGLDLLDSEHFGFV